MVVAELLIELLSVIISVLIVIGLVCLGKFYNSKMSRPHNHVQ